MSQATPDMNVTKRYLRELIVPILPTSSPSLNDCKLFPYISIYYLIIFIFNYKLSIAITIAENR